MENSGPPSIPCTFFFDRGSVAADPDLDRELARKAPGGLRWDPRTRQFRLPAHRWRELKGWLEGRGVPFRYFSGRPAGFRPEPGRAPPLLRPYQRAALEAWAARGCRGSIELPTGSGKTRLAIACLLALGGPALIVVPTCHLLAQWKAALEEFYPGPIAVFGDGRRDLQPVTVMTFDSAYLHLDRFGDHFDLLIADEAHHLAGGDFQEIPMMATAPYRLGLSATFPAEAEERARLEELLGSICYSISISRLAGSWLAPFEVKVLPLRLAGNEQAEHDRQRALFLGFYLPFMREYPRARWEDFVRAASRTVSGREALAGLRRSRSLLAFPRAKLEALDCLLEQHAAEPTLVFTGSNQTAYEISRRFLIPAITCEIGRAERQEILQRFEGGRYRAVVSAKVLNEGMDVPSASCAIVVGGTSSPREHIQRLGRILRPRPEKRAVLYELVILATSEWAASEKRNRADVFRSAPSL
ncbi:MAG: DEAD/DEAH box helicase [Planctomycetes bacterium]|nr:DEAD/DEAH box helicase [Planctomycetota bacterium]